jgi:stage V sporulation protein SpoVS
LLRVSAEASLKAVAGAIAEIDIRAANQTARQPIDSPGVEMGDST